MNIVYITTIKVILPISLLSAALLRYNGFSGFYLLFCLCILVFDFHRSSTYFLIMLYLLLIISTLFALSHPIAHILLIFYPTYLKNCSSTLVLGLHQVGITNLQNLRFHQGVRLVMPDIWMIIVSIVCAAFIHRTKITDTLDKKYISKYTTPTFRDRDVSLHSQLWTSWLYQRIKIILNVFLTCFAGIISPSFLNITYFLIFMIGGSIWSSGISVSYTNLYFYRIFILTYSGMHIILIYMVQIEYFQSVFPNNALYSRLLGLYYSANSSCIGRGSITIRSQRFFDYLNPFVLLLLFYMQSLDSKIWLDNRTIQNLALFTKFSSSRTTRRNTNNALTSISISSDMGSGIRNVNRPFIWSVINSMIRNSYIVSFIAMMAWSVTYKSWLTFVLLVAACILWLIPDSRSACLFMSPFIVVYGIVLIFINYVMNINGREILLAITYFSENYFEMNELGIFSYKIPFIPLLATIGYLVVFWLTLRLSIKEKVKEAADTPNLYRERSSVMFDDDTTYKNLIHFIHKLCAKYWIFACCLCLLLVSIQSKVKVIYIIYMVLLIILMTLFMFSYTVWRKQLYVFWWIVVMYSLTILFSIYTFQFKIFREWWFNYTKLTKENLKDFGLEKFDISSLFEGLMTPVVLLVVTIIQVHYFHNIFMRLSSLRFERQQFDKDPIYEFQMRSGSSSLSAYSHNFVVSSLAVFLSKFRRKKENDEALAVELNYLANDVNIAIYSLTKRLTSLFKKFYIKLWRILEVHFTKVVVISMTCFAVNEVNAFNSIYIILIAFLYPFDTMHNILIISSFLLLSSQMIASMLFQLIFVSKMQWNTDCRYPKSDGTIASNIMDNIKYFGLVKYNNFQEYGWKVAINMTLCCFWHVIAYHQTQFYNIRNFRRPDAGIVFPGFSYSDMNDNLLSGIKIILNFAFYKCGLEMCFMMTVLNAYLRLDVFSVYYLVLIMVFIPCSRLFCSKLWSLYLFILILLLLVQYAICVGLPPFLCQAYPFNFDPQLQSWLFLPSYKSPPDSTKLIGDMFQFMFVTAQYHVFNIEKAYPYYCGGENRPILINELPSSKEKDFLSNKDSYIDYLKQIVFCWFYWMSLGIVFLNGIMRNTLFSLGYMMLATVYFWIGQQFILSKRKYLLSSWNILLFYNFLIILIKCLLQLVSCVYIEYLYSYSQCWLIHILGIQCIHRERSAVLLQKDSCGDIQNDFFWDVLCFMFLIIQRKIFTTKLFCFVVLDMKVTSKFTSRGALLMNRKLINILADEKNRENQLFSKIKEKILKIEQTHQNYGKPLPNEHYLVLRSGDYFLFEGNLEDDDDEDEINEEFNDEFDERYGESADDIIFRDVIKSRLNDSEDNLVKDTRASKFTTKETTSIFEQKLSIQPKKFVMQDKPSIPRHFNENNKLYMKKDFVVLNPEILSSSSTDTFHTVPSDIVKEKQKKEEKESNSEYWISGTTGALTCYNCFLKCFDSLIARINLLTKDIRYVRAILENEKRIIKRRIITYAEGDWLGTNLNSFYVFKHQGQTLEVNVKMYGMEKNTEDHFQIRYRIVELESIQIQLISESIIDLKGLNSSNVENPTKMQQFRKSSSRLLTLCIALGNLIIIYSDMLCYFILVLNHMISFNVLSLLYPLSVFLWAMLSTPRPSTVYWIFIILYTQLVILIKYIFQFKFIDIEYGVDALQKDSPFFLPVLFGIEKKTNYALVDLLQLFVLFLHRGYLKNHGLWKNFNEKVISSEDFKKHEENLNNVENIETNSKAPSIERNMFLKPIFTMKRFYMKLTSHRFTKRVDVYVYMFICEFISFFIIVFGYETFGPGTGSISTALDFLKSNKIPVPFVLMLITQFIFMIIDRALFLRKQVIGKLVFQIFYVILIHVWIFFLNPYISRSKFNTHLAPQFLYLFKCIYFALSAYQIKSGYPLRILGNFLTKKYNYLNLFLFKGYLIVPFLYELRNVMDWIWTDTALSLYHWMEVEDVFAKVFVLKCWRRSELEYPTPRGTNRWHVTKYLVGGLLMIFFFLCFWAPLTLGSVIGSIFVRNPPVLCQFKVDFDGFSATFEYNARGDKLTPIHYKEYDYLNECYKHNVSALSFLTGFEMNDITQMYIDRTSENLWPIAPPNLWKLITTLSEDNVTINLNFITTCIRDPGDTKTTKASVSYIYSRRLSKEERTDIVKLIQFKIPSVILRNAFPRFYLASKTDLRRIPSLRSHDEEDKISIKLYLRSGDNAWWWEMASYINQNCLSKNKTYASQLHLYIFSERISDNIFGELFSRYGIIGIYAAYIFVAHRLLRAVYSNISYIIRCEELPYVDRILKLLNEIYLVRENKMFRLEEQLVAKLIFVYRSDETMIRFTRHKQVILDEHMDK